MSAETLTGHTTPTPRAATVPLSDSAGDRAALVRRGLHLNYLTVGYNFLEAGVALAAGIAAGSVSLVGFGTDSVVELTASIAAQWRLRMDAHTGRRARVERKTQLVVGASLVALAAWAAYEAVETLWTHEAPARSVAGVVILALSVVVMPLLARAKYRVARSLDSRALTAEATQTVLCAYLSVIALAGVALNALLDCWWADPAAALAMTPIIAWEGVKGLRGTPGCTECGCG
ncbi:MAG TPA: cation transporter [Gemmatimonadaceae bacterium]|nr:cation transporter [Gemmatimonadaceae bacterium]